MWIADTDPIPEGDAVGNLEALPVLVRVEVGAH
jgi:hypothetical protein